MAAPQRISRLRIGGLALLVTYPVLTHYAIASGRDTLVLLALSGLILGLVVLLVSRPIPRMAAAAAAIVLVWQLPDPARWLMYLPPVLIDLALCWAFARTLGGGREPLITRFARLEGRPLDARQLAYTRRLTLVWAVFFSGLAAVSMFLAWRAPPAVWSLFTNGAGYVMALLLFLGEHVLRRVHFRGYVFATPVEQVKLIVGSALPAAREPA